jgi:uncharacterized repeat protein (TIGR04138 family)
VTEAGDGTPDPIDALVSSDGRFQRDAYLFVLAAVEFVVGRLAVRRHVSGRELLDGIRELGLARFGLMTMTVFEHWGVTRTEDFGAIVFQLVDGGLLSKTEEDSMRDFEGAYDFHEAFVEKFPWGRGQWDV